MSTRLLAVLAVLFLLVVACEGGDSAEEPTTTVPPADVDDETPSDSVPPDTTPETTLPEEPEEEELPEGTEELPEDVRGELAELIAITEEVRRLEFQEPPDVAVVTGEELAERVRDQLSEDLEDIPADQALYRLLGLLEDDTNLESLYTDLYSEQVAGYYDGEEGELVVPRSEEGFTSLQRATLVHELAHALTDQHYGFHDRYSTLLDEDRYDEASAFQALIEGDAVLAELFYLQNLSAEEQAQFFDESFGVDQEVFESAPRFIRDALVFPYDSGFLFIDRLFQTGGYEAIAQAYDSPPTSTEQIIDPADYPADAPIDVQVETLSIDGFDLEYESTWGELSFALMFDQILDPDTSDTAAGGWGGDSYQVHFDGTDVVLVLHYRGDSDSDGQELQDALTQYVEEGMDVGDSEDHQDGLAYRGEDAAWVYGDGADVIFVASSLPAALDPVVESSLAAADGQG